MSDQDFLFDYELPRELVAQEPLRYRADARMMVVDRKRQSVEHHHIRDLPYLLPAGDRLVMMAKATRVHRRQITCHCQGFVGATMVFHADIIGMPITHKGQ